MLQLITAEYLYKHHPGATEGELTQTRSSMVNTNTLADLAEQLDLGSYLYLGKGISKGGGRNLKSLLANAFEAVLGAVFLDAGYDAAYHYYLNRYRHLPEPVQDENYKVVFAGGDPLGTGHGATKQEAEQGAARAALESLVGTVKPLPAAKVPRASRTRARRPKAPERTSPEPAAESTPLTVLPEPEPELLEPPRSRQFGEPAE